MSKGNIPIFIFTDFKLIFNISFDYKGNNPQWY